MRRGHANRGRRDESEPAIVSALEQAGAIVRKLEGKDIPDLLVLHRGLVHLLEVKQPAGPRGGRSQDGQKLSRGQDLFRLVAASCAGVQVHVVHDEFEALKALGIEKQEIVHAGRENGFEPASRPRRRGLASKEDDHGD